MGIDEPSSVIIGRRWTVPHVTPTHWQPKHVLHVKFELPSTRKSNATLTCTQIKKDWKGRDLDDYILNYLDDVSLIERTVSEGTILDITVSNWCYVVLDLREITNWYFLSGSPAVTTKDEYGERNFNLTQYSSHKTPTVNLPQPRDNCQIAVLAIGSRRRGLRDGINIHVEIRTEDYNPVIISIDPDIKNTGEIPPPGGDGY